MLRSDIHRPSVIVPSDYTFICHELVKVEGLGDVEFIQAERRRLVAHMEKTGASISKHEHGGNCHICGSVNAIYTNIFYHKKSNSYVRVGNDCSEKLDYEDDGAFRRNVQDARKNIAGKLKAQSILQERGLIEAWNIHQANKIGKYEENTIIDIVSKLVIYGELSEKQIAFIGKLLEKISLREEASVAPVPETDDRIEIIGEIVTVKMDEFEQLKILVKSEKGWKIYGSLPSTLSGVRKGSKVSFYAKVERSQNDPGFGFFSRPSKAKVLVNA